MTSVADAAAGRVGENSNVRTFVERQMRSELRLLTDVPVGDLLREADDLARQYREVDIRLQVPALAGP